MTKLTLPINSDSLIIGQRAGEKIFSYPSHLVTPQNRDSDSLYQPSDEEVFLTLQKQRIKDYIKMVFLRLMHDAEFTKILSHSYNTILDTAAEPSHPPILAANIDSNYYNLIHRMHEKTSDTSDNSDSESSSDDDMTSPEDE